MITEFDIMIKEAEIGFNEIQADLIVSPYMESSDFFFESEAEGNFFTRMIEKIGTLINNIKEKIISFFKKDTTEKTVKEIEDVAKENPAFLRTHVTMADYNALYDLSERTQKQLMNEKCDVEKTMKKYRKQRNIILAAGAAVTISLGAALVIVTKKKDEKISSLEKLYKSVKRKLQIKEQEYEDLKQDHIGYKNKAEDKIKSLNNTVSKQNDTIEELKAKGIKRTQLKVLHAVKQPIRNGQQAGKDLQKSIDQTKEQVVAIAECTKDMATDTANECSDAFKVLTSNASIVKKAQAGMSVAANIASGTKNIVSGKAISDKKDERAKEISKKGYEIAAKIKKYDGVLNHPKASDERKQTAQERINTLDDRLKTLAEQYENITGIAIDFKKKNS